MLVQLRESNPRTPRVLTVAEGNTEASVIGEDVEVRRSPQAVACRKRYAVELGKPQRFQEIMVHYTSEMLDVGFRWEGKRDTDKPLHTDGVSYQAYYSEVGKAHYMGKDLTEVRSPQRKLVPDKVGLEQYEQTSLRGIVIKAELYGKHRFYDLYKCLNYRFLMECWKDLNKNAASGVDQVTRQVGTTGLFQDSGINF